MAAKIQVSDALDSTGSKAVKLPMLSLLAVVVFGVWLGLAGAGAIFYLLAKSGRLHPIQFAGNAPNGNSSQATYAMVMEPILVNLADPGGHAYLRLGMTLNVVGEAEGAAAPPASPTADEGASGKPAGNNGATSVSESSLRDTLLLVLGEQNSASLLGPDGKERLKLELEDAIRRREPGLKVQDVFFTEFLVQI